MGFFDLQVNGYAGVDFNGDDLAQSHRGRCQAADRFRALTASSYFDRITPFHGGRLKRLLSAQRTPLFEIHGGFHISPFYQCCGWIPRRSSCRPVLTADTSAMQTLLDAADGWTLCDSGAECDRGSKSHDATDGGIVVLAGQPMLIDTLKSAIVRLTMFTILAMVPFYHAAAR